MDFKLTNNFLRFLLCFILAVFFFSLQTLHAQEVEKRKDKKTQDTKSVFIEKGRKKNFDAYYFTITEKETPRFTQIIRWTDSEGVLRYEVTLKTEGGKIIFERVETTSNTMELNLKPGKYFYKVYAFNMLNILETESDWIDINIKKALKPNIQKLVPQRLYIEDDEFGLEVEGEGFTQDADIYFISSDGTKKRIKPVKIESNKILFDLQNPSQFLGSPYFLTITNPSGLSSISNDFIVKYRKAMDFYFGLAYTPFSPLYGEWYKSHWNKKFYPLSASTELGVIFLKSSGGFIGAELRATYRKSDLVLEDIKIKNHSYLFSANFLYEYWFMRRLAFMFKAGAGVTISKFSTEDKRKYMSIDPMYTLGLGLRTKPIKKYMYLDIGLYLDQFFNKGIIPLFIYPSISIGFRY